MTTAENRLGFRMRPASDRLGARSCFAETKLVLEDKVMHDKKFKATEIGNAAEQVSTESSMIDSEKEKRRADAIAWLEKWGAVFNQAKTEIVKVVPM